MTCGIQKCGLAGLVFLTISLCIAGTASAGGGPQNVLIVVNDQSIESLEIGNRYRVRRGIPERNICHVSVPPLEQNMTNLAFRTSVVDVVHQHIADNGLGRQIDYIVLCKDLPSRVNDTEGTPAVLFYGFKNALAYPMPASTRNGFFEAERAFSHQDSYSGTNAYLTFLLTAENLVQAENCLDHGADADGTAPTGTIYLLKSGDGARNIRYKTFDDLLFDFRFFALAPAVEVLPWDVLFGKSSVLGCVAGAPKIAENYGITNGYLPGAFGDHLTSYGGALPTGYGQATVLKWIESGASASYGTVTEPYAYLQKFPNPRAYYWYSRGFNLAESYWMSVANPYQGIFVGEPLASPYASRPTVALTNLYSNQVVSGTVTVLVSATTNAAGCPSRAIDVFMDGLWFTNAVTANPMPGNVLSLSVSSVTCRYTVASADTLYDAVEGLCSSVNASNLAVHAYARSDRALLVYTNYGHRGSGITYSAATHIGTAAVISVWGNALSSNLLESTYTAREYIRISAQSAAGARAGDSVSCVITLTNAPAVTNRIVATAGQQPTNLVELLVGLINSNAALQGTNGVKAVKHTPHSTTEFSLDARSPGPEGYNIRVDFIVTAVPPFTGLDTAESFSDKFNDSDFITSIDTIITQHVLTARGNALFWCGAEPLNGAVVLDTAAMENGPHTLLAVAREGSGTENQGYYSVPFTVSNSAFQCFINSPTNGQEVLLGSNLPLTATTTNASGVTTQVVFFAAGKPFATVTAAPFETNLHARNYGVGELSVQARARDTAGDTAITEPVIVHVRMDPLIDTDGDGVADAWEQHYFGGLYVYGATNDLDDDAKDNYAEYIADTDPLDSASVFTLGVDITTNRDISVFFSSSTGRVYRTEYNNGFATNAASWLVATTNAFYGNGNTREWVDDGTETGIHPLDVEQRIYRVEVDLP